MEEKFLDKRIEVIEPFGKLRAQIKMEKFIADDLLQLVSGNVTRVQMLFPLSLGRDYASWRNEVRAATANATKDVQNGKVIYRLDDESAKELMASGLVLLSLMINEAIVLPDSAIFDD